MALSRAERRKLLETQLPADNEVRRELQDYLDRTGLTLADFAHRINYSREALAKFVGGTYEQIAANSAMLRSKIVDFMRTHPVGAGDGGDGGEGGEGGTLYETEDAKILRRYFYDALDRARGFYVEGAPGTQKSYVLQYLVAELNRNELAKNGRGRRAYYVYCPAKISRCNLMKLIAQAAGTPSQGDVQRILRNLRFDMGRRRVVLVLDEAQHLDVDCIETIRELFDLPPHFGLLFAGSHRLERMFTLHAVELEQWNGGRLQAGRRLPGLSEDEARTIIRGELGEDFAPAKIERLVKASRAKALASDGEQEYINARRLFWTIRDLKQASGKAATE